jgi:hypothetical protein
MDKRKYFIFGLLPLAMAALAFILSFNGCTPKPTEAPPTTVITGTGQLSVSSADNRDSYSFVSGGVNYGKINLVWFSSSLVTFEANGIVVGTGTTAPDSGYGTSSTVSVAYSYFVKTDNVVHYARVDVTSINENSSTGYTTVGFNWVLQTEANNRSLN